MSVSGPTGIAFAVALAAEALLLGGLVVSIVRPAWRVWPPGEPGWRFWWSWGLLAVVVVASLAVAWLDRGTFVLDHPAWRVAGVVVFVAAETFNEWAVRSVRRRASWGLKAELSVRGPYRRTRNPQTLAQSAMIVGLVLVVDSALLVVVGLIGIACLVLIVVTEESWLEATYGDAYRRYRHRVPRFLGRRRGPE